jgi:hypothetical protein
MVSGRVERISLLPSGTNECPARCPATATPQLDGTTLICISNDCGCQVTDIRVDQVLLGNGPGEVLQVKSRLGEWCKPTFPNSTGLLLVQMKNGTAHWSKIDTRDGVRLFDAKSFDAIGKVTVASLKHANGQVLLEDLLRNLAEQR